MVNNTRNDSAYSIGVVSQIAPWYSVAVQLKTFTPDGMATSIVSAENAMVSHRTAPRRPVKSGWGKLRDAGALGPVKRLELFWKGQVAAAAGPPLLAAEGRVNVRIDPAATVARDVDLLRTAGSLSARISFSGHVYDIATGLVETVIPAARAA